MEPPARLIEFGRGRSAHGGTLVCETRAVIGEKDLPRLRAALRWFAGDVYVEQPV